MRKDYGPTMQEGRRSMIKHKNQIQGAVKKFTVLVLLLATLSTSVAKAGDDNWSKCVAWNASQNQVKLAYLEGWGSAITVSEFILTGDPDSRRYLRDRLWPKGYEAASFMVEVDRWCSV